MLRAKHARFKSVPTRRRDRMLSASDRIGTFLGVPIVAQTVNALNRNKVARKLLQTAGIHPDAKLPEMQARPARKRLQNLALPSEDTGPTPPLSDEPRKMLLFTTCYGNYNRPDLVEDMMHVLQHNDVQVQILPQERCCGMPKMELGDLEGVRRLMEANIPPLLAAVKQGYDITTPIPSCVLMFRQELPLLFPNDADVHTVAQHFHDPFEYLAMLHKEDRLKTDFNQPLGHVAMHAACHQRVQNIGNKTREILELVPDTRLTVMERCSGHDGTYAVKSETHAFARKICRPLTRQLDKLDIDHYGSDCPLAGDHIGHCAESDQPAQHPIQLLRRAYGI